jgi:ribose 5-phosphate isomerase B
MKPIVVMGSDHAGYAMKEYLKQCLQEQGYTIEDMGTDSEASVDAGIYAVAVGEAVAADPQQKKGILVCGTGIGMSMNANKVKGVRASLVSDLFSAQMTRAHNDANILCLGARVLALPMAWEITKIWLMTEPLGGKYAARVVRMMDYEKKCQ